MVAGARVGAALDIAAFQQGDFDGDGKRDLPNLTESLRLAWPDPNVYVYPFSVPSTRP